MIVTAFGPVADMHAATLEALFGNAVDILRHSYDLCAPFPSVEADLYVFSTYPIYLNAKHRLPPFAKTVIMGNTIGVDQYERIARIANGARALVVNYSVEMTMDTITLFRQLGIGHLELIPYYPGVVAAPEVDLAITPGEARYVPESIREVIDIGHRVLDEKTIVDIAHFLSLEGLLAEPRFGRHFARIKKARGGVASLFDVTNVLENQLSGLLDAMEDGLIVADDAGIVYASNHKALEVLDERGSLVGKRLSDLLSGVPSGVPSGGNAEGGHAGGEAEGGYSDYRLAKVKSRNVTVKVAPLIEAGRRAGLLATINTFDEKEKNQGLLRAQLLGKGHRAKFDFDSIVTKDPDLIGIKALARRKADSNSSILIIGETGTGKELFAHAIHADSRRRKAQFVTINCAALPESLLESELFGYAEGAFTGARKGGKPGLFELAHVGTIFLDEIGEMQLGLQARLLRVLESREVMRLGGDSLVPVDIRVIAATNKDLWNLVRDGGFRQDLYYRLNVLQIEIPPLRERPGDILLLFDSLAGAQAPAFFLSEEARDALVSHPWFGNVRELKNCVEYVACLGKSLIEAEDLWPLFRHARSGRQGLADPARLADRSGVGEGEGFVLACLFDNYRRRLRTGRRSIEKRAIEAGLFLTEAQIRRMLVDFEAKGYVLLSRGRGGAVLTDRGIEACGSLGLK